MGNKIEKNQNIQKPPEGLETSETTPMYVTEAAMEQSSDTCTWESTKSEAELTPSEGEEGEEQLLSSPLTPGTVKQLDDATSLLENLKVKPIKLSGAQRKRAMKERLAEKGIPWDPKKWKPGRGRKSELANKAEETPKGGAKRSRSEGSTPTFETSKKKPKPDDQQPSTSGKKETYKEALTSIKMAIAPENYPVIKLTEEQGEKLQEAIIGAFEELQDGSFPQFAGSYMEKGAFILSCANQQTKNWLEAKTSKLQPWENARLIVGLKGEILKTSKVLFKTPAVFSRTESPKILDLLGKQNPTLKPNEWRIVSSKASPSGKTLVCIVEEDSAKKIKALGNKAFLGLGRVFFTFLDKDDKKKDNPDQPSA